MSGCFLAIQVWWQTLVDAEFGRQVAELLAGKPGESPWAVVSGVS